MEKCFNQQIHGPDNVTPKPILLHSPLGTQHHDVMPEPCILVFSHFKRKPWDFRVRVFTPLKKILAFLDRIVFTLFPGLRSWYALRLRSGCSGPPGRTLLHLSPACLPFVSHLPLTASSTLWMLRPHESIDVPDGCVNIGIDVAEESEPGKTTRSKTRSKRDASEIRALAGPNSRKVQSEASIEVQRHSKNGPKT